MLAGLFGWVERCLSVRTDVTSTVWEPLLWERSGGSGLWELGEGYGCEILLLMHLVLRRCLKTLCHPNWWTLVTKRFLLTLPMSSSEC